MKQLIISIFPIISIYTLSLYSPDRSGYEWFIESGNWPDLFYSLISEWLSHVDYEVFAFFHISVFILAISSHIKNSRIRVFLAFIYLSLNLINISAQLRFILALGLLLLFHSVKRINLLLPIVHKGLLMYLGIKAVSRIQVLLFFHVILFLVTVMLFLESTSTLFLSPSMLGAVKYALPLLFGLLTVRNMKNDIHFRIIIVGCIAGFLAQVFTQRFGYMWLIFPVLYWNENSAKKLLFTVVGSAIIINLIIDGSIISSFNLNRIMEIIVSNVIISNS